MNALEKAQELIENGQNVPKRTLLVAYLALHMQHPAIHPDDCLRNDGFSPYNGWEVIIAYNVIKMLDASPIQELMHYPTAFLKINKLLEELDVMHEDIWKDTDDDLDYQMWGNVGDCFDFFEDMDSKNLHMAVEGLQKLYLYHAKENDSAEEEAEKPAGTLKTCADVLLWISQQAN